MPASANITAARPPRFGALPLLGVLGVVTLMLLPASRSLAEVRTWDGGGGGNNWTIDSNWVGDVAPLPTDVLIFDGSVRLSPNNNNTAGTQFNGIIFASTASAFNLFGNAITLGGNITNFSSFNQTNSQIAMTNTGALEINTGAAGITFLNTGTKFSTASTITKTGSGTLTLTAGGSGISNNFIINEGTVMNAAADSTVFGNEYTVMAGGTAVGTASSGGVTGAKGVKIANGAMVTFLSQAAGVTNTVNTGFFGDASYGQGTTVAKSGAGILKIVGTATNANFGATTANTWRVDQGTLYFSGGDATLGASSNRVVLNGGTLQASGMTLGASRTITLNEAEGNAIRPDDGTALVLNVANQLTGAGGFTKTGTGTLILNAAQNFSGATKVGEGRLQISNSLAMQNSVLDTSGAGTVGLGGAAATNVTFGGLSGSTDLATEIAAGYATVTNITLNTGSGTSASYSGAIANGAAGMALVKTGTGTQTLSGANTYSGATTVSAGKLVVDGSISSATTVQTDATLAGSGTVGSTVVESGGTIAPGNSPGTLTIDGDLTWKNGGYYDWEVFKVSGEGTAGTDWDLLDVTSSLVLTNLTGDPLFNINLYSLVTTDSAGALANWSATGTYAWKILSATNAISNFNASYFNINTANFSAYNNISGGLFALELRDDNKGLYLTYKGGEPVPEPGTWAVAALLAAAAFAASRRKVQRGKSAVSDAVK